MKLSWTSKRMILVIFAAALIIMAGGAAYHGISNALHFALGVLLTSGLNAAKVALIERTVQRTLEMEGEQNASNYVRLQSLTRLFLTAAVLAFAALNPGYINIWGAVAGLFTWQIGAYSMKFFKNNPDLS